MLSLLHIENIALIEEADIRFDPGFNVLTGETGAGKSIIIDSIGVLCGSKVSKELIRNGVETKLLDFEKQPDGKELPHVFAILYPEKAPSVEAIESMLEFFHKHADNKATK